MRASRSIFARFGRRARVAGAGAVVLVGVWAMGPVGLSGPPIWAQTPAPSGQATVSGLSELGRLPEKFVLTPGVERDLNQIYEQWIQWQGAFFKDQPEVSEQLVSGLLSNARQLGLDRLPGLSIGAGIRAVEAAERGGNFTKAAWALEAAERLDPGRPETAFARARVRRQQGRRVPALASELSGLLRTFNTFPDSALAGADLVLWLLFSLVASAALFVALQVAVKGSRLFAALEAMVGRVVSLPAPVLRFLALLLLLWPLLLPSGLLWLLLYWSALLFAYSSPSERLVIVALWLLVALTPLAVDRQRQWTDLSLAPAMRGVESLVESRLHGQLFQDLEQLAALLPEDPAVIQLMADMHRGLGQWEVALELYRRVVELEPDNASALIDIGGYYFFKKDYGSARTYYEMATEKEPDSVVAFYNLSQAFSENSFLFNDAREALQRAQEIDAEMVSRLQRETGLQRVVTSNGGVARAPEIRDLLARRLRDPELATDRERSERRGQDAAGGGNDTGSGDAENGDASENAGSSGEPAPLPLGQVPGALGAALLALLFSQVRPRDLPLGPRLEQRKSLRDVLVPGLASTREGQGGRAWVALLVPTALLTLPMVEQLAFPLFPIYSATGSALWAVTLAGLLVFVGVRIALARLG